MPFSEGALRSCRERLISTRCDDLLACRSAPVKNEKSWKPQTCSSSAIPDRRGLPSRWTGVLYPFGAALNSGNPQPSLNKYKSTMKRYLGQVPATFLVQGYRRFGIELECPEHLCSACGFARGTIPMSRRNAISRNRPSFCSASNARFYFT